MFFDKNISYGSEGATCSEFKAALNATKIDSNRRLYPFVRKEVWHFFNYWKDLVIKKQHPENWEIDRNLFPLLRDLETLSWTDTFDTSLDLKEMISKKVGYFA